MSRITPYMDIPERKLLLNAFFMSQFSYCPLVWMCHRRSKNHKRNYLHERCFRTIYCDKNSTFEVLLNKDDSVTIHKRNLQLLAIEMFKVAKNSAPIIFYEQFQKKRAKYL